MSNDAAATSPQSAPDLTNIWTRLVKSLNIVTENRHQTIGRAVTFAVLVFGTIIVSISNIIEFNFKQQFFNVGLFGECIECPRPYLLFLISLIVEFGSQYVAFVLTDLKSIGADESNSNYTSKQFRKDLQFLWIILTYCRFFLGLVNDWIAVIGHGFQLETSWKSFQCFEMILMQSSSLKIVIVGYATGFIAVDRFSKISMTVAGYYMFALLPILITHVILWAFIYFWISLPALCVERCFAECSNSLEEDAKKSNNDKSHHPVVLMVVRLFLMGTFLCVFYYAVDTMVLLYSGIDYFKSLTIYATDIRLIDWFRCAYRDYPVFIAICNFFVQLV